MQKRILLLTGNPGIGKTTVLIKTANALKAEGCAVGGMMSREAREGGIRVGFEILDLGRGGRGWLAHVDQKDGPQIGKYRVNIGDLNDVGAEAILAAVENCDVIVIDEIGPMELLSEKFKEAAGRALDCSKPTVAVVHWKAQTSFTLEARNREDTELITVTYENREKLHEVITERIHKILKKT